MLTTKGQKDKELLRKCKEVVFEWSADSLCLSLQYLYNLHEVAGEQSASCHLGVHAGLLKPC